jgi:hypothetical protein
VATAARCCQPPSDAWVFGLPSAITKWYPEMWTFLHLFFETNMQAPIASK